MHDMTSTNIYLYTGMLSKSKGLILRVAAVMHVAFHLETPHTIPKEICSEALEAAQDFIDMCCQHAAFMAGRGEIPDEIQQLQTGLSTSNLVKQTCGQMNGSLLALINLVISNTVCTCTCMY